MIVVSNLIDTTEMYLRTILELEEERVLPLRARIAESLGHSGPTVSQTVSRMQRDGLVRVLGDRQLELTVLGREKAVAVMRKHRLAERLLWDVIGLDWEYVHEEACRWEHVMSERVERRLYVLLDSPVVSPYGNPIPGLVDIGGSEVGEVGGGFVSLLDVVEDVVGEVVVEVGRLGEPVQIYPDLLGRLRRVGVVPGEKVLVRKEVGFVLVCDLLDVANCVELSVGLACHVFVQRVV